MLKCCFIVKLFPFVRLLKGQTCKRVNVRYTYVADLNALEMVVCSSLSLPNYILNCSCLVSLGRCVYVLVSLYFALCPYIMLFRGVFILVNLVIFAQKTIVHKYALSHILVSSYRLFSHMIQIE